MIILTSALIPFKYEERKNEYIKSFNNLINYVDKNSIQYIECYNSNPDFLYSLTEKIFITNTHDYNIKNKGVLEMKGIKKFLDNTDISDDELMLKLTGRYYFIDNHFIKTIQENNNFNFYGKKVTNNTQIFTGCFAIRKKYLQDFVDNLDYEEMENHQICVENKFFNYIEHIDSCYFLDNLNVYANIFGIGQGDLVIL
jgi:hypothetical protein